MGDDGSPFSRIGQHRFSLRIIRRYRHTCRRESFVAARMIGIDRSINDVPNWFWRRIGAEQRGLRREEHIGDASG